MTHATHSFDALMEITARPPIVFVRGEAAISGMTRENAISISSRAGR
jgi:hypothetical protein